MKESFSCSGRNTFGFCLFFVSRNVKTAFYMSWRYTWKERFFSEINKHFLTFPGTDWKKVGAFVKNFRMGLSRLLSRYPEDPFGDKCIFWKFCFYLHFLGRSVKFFHHYGKVFRPSGYSVPTGLTKLHSVCPREQFEGKFFLPEIKYYVVVFGHRLKKLWASVKHFWTWFSKLIFTWTEVHFEFGRDLREKYFFFVAFGFWSKCFWLDFQTCIPRVQRNTFRILPFFWKIGVF